MLFRSMTYSTDAKRALRDQWQIWSDQYKGARPFLQDQLGAGSQKAIDRQRALIDLRRMLDDKEITVQPELRSLLANMLNTYDSYTFQRDSITSNSAVQQDYKDMLKMNADAELKRLASKDVNAQSAYDILFSRLIGA